MPITYKGLLDAYLEAATGYEPPACIITTRSHAIWLTAEDNPDWIMSEVEAYVDAHFFPYVLL